jgi:hypothetical protein
MTGRVGKVHQGPTTRGPHGEIEVTWMESAFLAQCRRNRAQEPLPIIL